MSNFLINSYFTAAPVDIYYFLSAFDQAIGQPVSLSNGTTYTDAEDWIDLSIVGMTVVDTSSGTVRINNNSLELLGTGSWNTSTGIYLDSVARQDGLTFQWTHEDATIRQNTVAGIFKPGSVALADRVYNLNYDSASGTIFFQAASDGVINLDVGVSFSATAPKTETFIVDDTNDLVFWYSVGKLNFINSTSQTGDIAFAIQKNSTAVTQFSNIILPKSILNIAAITPSETLTDETAVDTFADIVLFGQHTAVTGQTLQIDYRGDVSLQNSWRVKVAQGSSNNVTLHKVTAGVESSALSTGSATINNGFSYNVQVHHQDTNYAKVYIDNVEKCTYTTPDAHQQSATNTKLTIGTVSTVSIGAFLRDGVVVNV